MRLAKCIPGLAPVVVALLVSCGGDMDTVWLEIGSQGIPGNGAVQGLDSGSMYLARNGRTWHPITSDGTPGAPLAQLNRAALAEALDSGDLQPLAAGTTRISGFSNGSILSVYKYGRPTGNWYLVADDGVSQGNQFETRRRNMVVDLSDAEFSRLRKRWIRFGENVMDRGTVFIFVTADFTNEPQNEIVMSGSAPDVTGGAEWYYSFGNMSRTESSREPFRIWVSPEPGQRGFFSVSGDLGVQPGSVETESRRGSNDLDQPTS